MRLALVHDWLDRPIGGGERVLLELASMYPDADVHTLLYDPGIYAEHLAPERVRTSWLQSLPAALRRRPRYLLPLIPSAVEQWDLSAYDVVLSSSVAFVKNVITPAHTVHVCYCHSPMRFAWDYWPRYLDELGAGPLRRFAVRAMVGRIRQWDHAGADRVDVWLCNGETTRARIAKYYRVDAVTVIPPPVALAALAPPPAGTPRRGLLTLSTLTEYKRVDLAVRTCARRGLPLTVAGDGPDRARLERLAGPTVRFTGRVDDSERVRLLQRAEALLFPGEDDFGITPVEALACGTPVVAYGRGGALETVADGTTGVLFDEQTEESLAAAIERVRALQVDTAALVASAQRFDAARFRESVRAAVDAALAARRG